MYSPISRKILDSEVENDDHDLLYIDLTLAFMKGSVFDELVP